MALEDQLWDRSHLAYDEVPATGRKTLTVNSGTPIELGDTGLRDVSGMFDSGQVASGQVVVRRKGDVVTWTIVNLVLAAGATHPWTIITNTGGVLTGFTPDYGSMTAMVQATDTIDASLSVPPSGTVTIRFGEPGVAYNGSLAFLTGRAWPTTLPGVVNGQPVGV